MILNLVKILTIIVCLYFFICSLDILSTAFKLIGGKATGEIFNATWLTNPFVGLMIGILGTVSVQSSSTFSSIIVAAIGAGLNVHIAVPMIMGANIGTSVTNTLVAMTQIGDRKEFERAFAAATVHDMFNWATVILLFTIECLIGTHFLENMTDLMTINLIGHNVTGAKIKILGHITDPLTDSVIEIDKKVLKKWASNQTCLNCRLLKQDGRFLFNIPSLSDQAIGGILLALALFVLCISLYFMVKSLNSLLQGSVAITVKKFVNPKFDNSILQYFYGYWNILLGAACTIIVQSSSVFTSTLTPLVGIGLIEVENVYPLFLGSNLGTTCTAMLAALTQSESESFKETVQGALVHLFFNVIGILVFYPIPFLRIPLPLCKKLGRITAQYRWFAIAYILGMFFVMPGIFVALTFIDPSSVAMYTVLVFGVVLLGVVSCINLLQSHKEDWLPKVLRDWSFLPEAFRSLAPYDRLITGCSLCRKCRVDPEADFDVQSPKAGNVNFCYEVEKI